MQVNLISEGVVVYTSNIYDTLAEMAKQVNLNNGNTLYDIIWMPTNHGIKYARDICSSLEEGYNILKSDKLRYKNFNPKNRMGSFTGLCFFVDEYKKACLINPECEIQVEDTVTSIIKILHNNRCIRFVHGQNKLFQPIHYDFRIDRCCSSEHINNIAGMMIERILQIERHLDTEFDSIFCSLFSGVFIGVSISMLMYMKYNRNIKISISRRSYQQKMGSETGTEKFLSSVHQLKNKTLVGELGNNVLIFDEMTNTGNSIKELINICKFNNVTPKACMIIADRILEPLPEGEHIRMYDDIPCYSSITHFEIERWCEQNVDIWNSLYEDMYDNQNTFTDEQLMEFANKL